MGINSLEIHNFKALRGHHRYDLPDGLTGLTGPNGAGKSTFVNSIAWAFFGSDAMRGVSLKENIVNWHERECKVEVGFDLDGHHYVCSRWQGASGSTGGASLMRDDEDKPLASGLAPVTEEMARLLGVDYTGWSISAFARQDELNGLSSLIASKRMQTVLRLLGIDNITTAIKTVRDRANADRRTLESKREGLVDEAALEAALSDAYSERSEADELARAIGLQMEELKGRFAALREERESVEQQRRAYLEYQNRINRAQQQVMFAEHGLKSARADAAKPLPPPPVEPESVAIPEHETTEQLYDRNNVLVEKRGEAQGIRAEIVRLNAQLAAMADPVCPTCHRPYDNADDVRKAKEAVEYQISERTAAYNEINELGRHLKAEYEQAYAQFEAAQKVEREYEAELNRYRAESRTYALVTAQRAEVQTKITDAESALAAAKEEHQQLLDSAPPDVEEKFRAILAEQEQVQETLSQISMEWSRHVASREQATREIDRLMVEKHAAEGRREEVASLEFSVVAYDTAAAELAKMKESLIGKVIPSLVDTASNLLAEMTNGKYTEMSLTPDYEIQYRNALGDLKGFENLSGGEKRVFALALRLAISDLKPNRLGVLFLDEVFESLDSESGRKEAVWEAVESLMGRYHQALLVTHVEEFKERASNTIRIAAT